jgi:hypothetical protein
MDTPAPAPTSRPPRYKLIEKGKARRHVADLLNVGRATLYRAPA